MCQSTRRESATSWWSFDRDWQREEGCVNLHWRVKRGRPLSHRSMDWKSRVMSRLRLFLTNTPPNNTPNISVTRTWTIQTAPTDHLTIMMPPKECINLKCWEHRYSEKSVVAIELIKCGRSFAPDVYEKHFDSNGHSTCANDVGKDQCVFNSAKACSLTIPI